jgi:hypothetical protein
LAKISFDISQLLTRANGWKWFLFFFCLLAFDLGLFGEQLLAARQDGNSRIPTNPEGSRVFP